MKTINHFLYALLLIGLSTAGKAHDLFATYVQHKIRITAGARHIDVVVDLTFFEEWSGRERARLDGDEDNRITLAERESYLQELAPELAKQVRLRIDRTEVDLMPLYGPELDLLGSDKAAPAHHRLRISLFAPTPAELKPGAEILVEDLLWPEAKALGIIEAEGRDGFVLKAKNSKDPAFPSVRQGEARVFKARCLEAPPNKPKE